MRPTFFSVPNIITFFRIFLAPIIVVLLISPLRVSAFVTVAVFLVAAGSDWLDGRIARRYNQITALGTLLDPIADKILVLAALISLVSLQKVPAWIVVALVARDITVSGIRQMGAVKGDVIPPSRSAKLKTAIEMGAVVIAILSIDLQWIDPVVFSNLRVSLLALLVALFLALWSAGLYLSRLLANVQMKRTDDRHPPEAR